jgi:hypothetical protein
VNAAVRPVPAGRKARRVRPRLRLRWSKFLLTVVVAYLFGLFVYGEAQDLRLGHEASLLRSAVQREERQNAALRAQVALLRERGNLGLLAGQALHLTKAGITPVEVVQSRR